MPYAIIEPPFTLRFREMSKPELKAYCTWFMQVLPERVAQIQEAVQETQPTWQADCSPESLDVLGEWFASQLQVRPRESEAMAELRSKLAMPIDIPGEELTNREKLVSAPGRRRQLAHARKAWKLSLRRACALLEVPRSGANYESKKAIADAPVVGKMRELAAQYPRYGYRMIRGLLATKGIAMSADRAHRLWRGAGLQVPRKRPRRRVAANRPRPVPPSAPNHVWAIDFVHDTCADGRPPKCLTVIDALQSPSAIRSPRHHFDGG